jgi:hypothetical protein
VQGKQALLAGVRAALARRAESRLDYATAIAPSGNYGDRYCRLGLDRYSWAPVGYASGTAACGEISQNVKLSSMYSRTRSAS